MPRISIQGIQFLAFLCGENPLTLAISGRTCIYHYTTCIRTQLMELFQISNDTKVNDLVTSTVNFILVVKISVLDFVATGTFIMFHKHFVFCLNS